MTKGYVIHVFHLDPDINFAIKVELVMYHSKMDSQTENVLTPLLKQHKTN